MSLVPLTAPCRGHKPHIPLLLAMLCDPALPMSLASIRTVQTGREFGGSLNISLPFEVHPVLALWD